jgi:hypothetical protein
MAFFTVSMARPRKSVFDVLIGGGKVGKAVEQASGVCLDAPPKKGLSPGYANVDL